MPSRYARKKSSADRRSKVLKKGTASAFGSSRANTLRGELTKEAANATDEGRSRHASESLNFFSSSSEPMALAAVERAVSVSRGRRKCHAKALRRAKTYPCSSDGSTLAAAGRHESDSLRRRRSSADERGSVSVRTRGEIAEKKSRLHSPCKCRRTWLRCTRQRRRP